MSSKKKFNWMRFWRCAAIATAWVGIVFFLGFLASALWVKAKPSRFTVMSLPRFEVSTARFDHGRKLTILRDKRTDRDFLLVETPTGATITQLPWKDQCGGH